MIVKYMSYDPNSVFSEGRNQICVVLKSPDLFSFFFSLFFMYLTMVFEGKIWMWCISTLIWEYRILLYQNYHICFNCRTNEVRSSTYFFFLFAPKNIEMQYGVNQRTLKNHLNNKLFDSGIRKAKTFIYNLTTKHNEKKNWNIFNDMK